MTTINRQVFVLMPFEIRFLNVYEMVIKPLETDSIKVNRADDLPFVNQQIYDSIIAAIENADVIVADLSDNNPNVFYELGYAHARGKIVIPINSSDRLPFDVAGFPTIFYKLDNLPELRSVLEKRLAEALTLTQTRDQQISDELHRELGRYLDEVEKYALTRARNANWSRPEMYFTESEVVQNTQVSRELSYRVLNALRDMNRITCLNWKGESVWMAS